MLISSEHPVQLCIVCSFVMLVVDAKGNQMEEVYSSIVQVKALFVASDSCLLVFSLLGRGEDLL